MIERLSELLSLLGDVPLPAWAVIAAVVVLQRILRRAGMWIYALFALPGTAAHELAHWLVAALTGARPQWPRLWPARTERGWRLGSVTFQPAWWRTAPIALAPLLLVPLALFWTVHFMSDAGGGAMLLHGWIAGTMWSAALPSRTDLRLAAPGMIVAAGIGAAALLAARL